MNGNPLFYLLLLAVAAVVVVLVFGLGSFAKGGKDSAKRGNKMMQYRIIAQAVAVALIVILILINRGGGN